ncbi:MAG: PilZ domain-containing protein [Candidatus Omnitrophota bacterium]
MADKDQNNKESVFEERRKFLRLNINVDIKYAVLPSSDNHSGSSRNISAGGICIITHEELLPGDRLKLDISLPDDPSMIQTIGQVVWTKTFSIAGEGKNRYDVGVEFIDISDEERGKIKKYVFSLS